jgi:chromosome segregation ATPase
MEPRLRPPAPGSPSHESDLDSTDELPALDIKAYEAATRDRLADTWVQPGLKPGGAAAEEPRRAAEGAEDPLQTAAANLREAQELLASRAARLADIERALEEAHRAHAGAERRAEQLGAELSQARTAAGQRAAARAAAEADARAAAERRETEHAAELAATRAAAAQREAELGEELARARAAAGQQASDLAEELAAARRAAEQREAQHSRELGEEKIAGEQRMAAERETAAEAQRNRDGDLQELRVRAASYFESFQSAERRRSLFEGLLSDLQDEVDAHESIRARLARELAGRDVRAGELESDLSHRAARIADLDSQVSTLAAALQQRDVELTRLRAVEASLSAALEAARAATATVTTRAGEHETALTETLTRVATLAAELGAERKRSIELDQELTRVRGEMEEWAGALRTAQLERSGHMASVASGEARVKQLEDRVAEQVEMLRTLQTASDAAIARNHELEADLRAAEDGITRLESQLRGRNVRVSELEKANQQWRHTLEESRSTHVATDTHQALHDAVPAGAEGGADAPLEGATRLLIRSDGGREVVHVLGRKTSIGRTPENDLQIDAKYISRHHAVILAGPAHTIIEDLNSTNGVMVNGRRISRQILKDGDQVMIGRAEYRFAVRRTGEKR